MSNPEIRELEAFLALAEELHFGRAGERLYLSQSRISQLLRALESRIGGRLVDRTSRRVRLTPLGEQLHAGLRPAFDAIVRTVDEVRDVARGVGGRFRVGFQGTANDPFMRAVVAFRDGHPECAAEIVEIPLSDPFGAVRRGEVDAAVVLMPVRDEELVLGPVFSARPLTLAVSDRHPYARRPRIDAEDLAGSPLIGVHGAAPEYWRLAQAPVVTPAGRAIPPGPSVSSLQEGLALVRADRGTMLLCDPTADYYGSHAVTFVPVTGLPESALALVWHRNHETARTRGFARALADVTGATG
ncbi:LysR family transcriptional regulator [Streptomyces sp. ID01-9D]|uniref:LysR family transcriptional regulator n=1 Tax=Streptomyces sp. ID01-9D TaxID=3028659 RepID=UPI0029C2FD21|nr:LysR family transcriptional regulator [Streptomyces sp. ID01-9D]MDX5576979.1 LysR family transcriptional regulator [Streptomyces sp. ID01-9D]